MDNNPVADQVLDRYLSAPQSSESEELGELLASRAEPIIRKVVFWRIGESRTGAEDVCSEAMLNLVQRLHRHKEDNDSKPIRDFSNYAAATAHHACDQYLRRKNPELWRLRNRIRYVIEHDAKLALWRNSQGAWLCGLAVWNRTEQPASEPGADPVLTAGHLSLRESLSKLLHTSNGPLALSQVLELARSSDPASSFGEPIQESELPDNRPSVDREIEQRRYAAELWKEITELPQRQSYALLCNLKDDAMNLLLLTGVASFKDISLALAMQIEELAALWKKLPFDDSEIARRLGCTRQQVINLRMAARKRLANRLAGWR